MTIGRIFQIAFFLFAFASGASLPVLANATCGAGSALANVVESTPDADFVDNGNGTVIHLKTGLIWKRCVEGLSWDGTTCSGNPFMVPWSGALQISASATFAGATDWRLPNRKELESIVEYCGADPAINLQQFPPTPSARFWSSTTGQENHDFAWDVYFSDGYSGLSRKDLTLSAVRLVRTAPTGSLLTPQRISFGPVSALAVGASGLVSATSSAGLPVSLSTLTPAICALTGSTVSGRSEGTCTIAADQVGSANVYPAPRATVSFAVGRVAQTISFASPSVLAMGGSVSITASASSGLLVTLSVATPRVCSLVGDRVMALAVGFCTIIGQQAGDTTFLPANPTSLSITIGGANGGSGGVDAPTVSYSQSLLVGWHLLGNGLNTTINVAERFADAQIVESLWKWLPDRATWAFYSPALSVSQLQNYLASKSFHALSEIRPGEAYWVKLKQAHDFGTQAGEPVQLGSNVLASGWNLVTTGDETTPAQLNLAFANVPPAAGSVPQSFVSLWAWDPSRGRWFFYSPALEAQGGNRLKEYVDRNGFLDFASEQKRIGRGVGFWIRK